MLQLIDKGYYDYDYEKVVKVPEFVNWEDTLKSDEEVQDIISIFGFKTNKTKKPETAEEIQEYLIKQESYNGGRNSSNS